MRRNTWFCKITRRRFAGPLPTRRSRERCVVSRPKEIEMADCPKCRGQMTAGFAYMPDLGSRVRWVDGEPGFWNALKSGFSRKATELSARRCSQCGFVEFFADTSARPVKTLATIEGENEQLRRLVTKLQDRVATLETIATDPAERTAREIESLRALPRAGGGSED